MCCWNQHDKPPKNKDEVYKVYYHYRILKFWKDDDGKVDRDYYVLYDSECDECSVIDEVAIRLKYLSEGKTEVEVTHDDNIYTIKLLNTEIYEFADCTFWKIIEHRVDDMYKFELFRNDDVGFRFSLDKEKAYEFGKYLQSCCDYMLAHGDPI